MSDDTTFFRGQQVPESVKARLLAAQLAQQLAAQQERPYTSKGVVALKALSGLMGGVQERQAIDGEQQAQAAHRAALAQILSSSASPAAIGTAGATGAAPISAPTPSSGGVGSDRVATGNPSAYDAKATEALIRSRAPAYGIDPDTAVKVARSEGLNVYHGDGGSSFGPFQLHYGNVAGGGNKVGGLGDTFTKQTGLDARDPSTVPQQVDFALSQASQGGWGPWHGAQRVGLSNYAGIGKGGGDPDIAASPRTAAGQLASTPGSDAVPRAGVGNRDPGLAVDMPASNAQPVASNTLPPGITPDMVSAPAVAASTLAGGQGSDTLGASSPFGGPPQAMAAPTGADPKALAAALRASVPGATSMGSDIAQPPVVPDPQGSLTALSPFGAGPSPMAAPSPSPNTQALAAALRRSVQQPPVPAVAPPAPMDPTAGLSPNALQAAVLGGGDPSALAGMAQPAPAPDPNLAPGLTAPAMGPSDPNDPQSNAFDYAMLPSGTRDQYAASPQAGGLGAAPPSPDMASMLAPPDPGAGSMLPAQPPLPPPGGQTGTPGANPPALAGITTQSMAKAGLDTSGLPGAMPPQGSVAGLGPSASATAAKNAAMGPPPMLLGANVPPPDLSGLGGQTTPAPPAALAQALRAQQPVTNPSRQPRGDDDTSLPDTGPMPPPRPSDVALGLSPNPDAPAPNAASAGPAPVPPGLLAQALRTSQPLGLAGDGGADPSSARAFLTQQAQASAPGGASPSVLAQALRGNSPAAASPPAPTSSPASQPTDSSPLDGLGRLFNVGSGSSGGNPLANIPVLGSLFGGGQDQQAQAGYGNGQGQQGAPFTPGGQGAQSGQTGTPAGSGQAPSGLGGMSQAQALALLSDSRTTPQEAQAIMSRAFPQPMIEKTSDGKIVSIDPRGGPARVLYSGQGYRPATADERKSYGITDDRPFTFGPDGKPEFGAVDPNAKETTEVRDYNMVVKQAQAAGQTPPSFADYQTGLRRSGAASVTIDQKAENAEAQARGAGLGKRLNDVADDSSKVTTEGIQVARIRDLLGQTNTGPGTAYAEKFRQATGIALDPKTDTVQALQAAIQNLAPALRVPGSGSQSDTELKNFQSSIPGLMNTPGGNEQILRTLEGAIAYRQQRSAIAQQWQIGKIDAQTADAKIAALPSPFAARQDAPSGASNAPAAAPTAQQPVPQAAPAPQGGGYLPGAARPQAGFTAPPTASAAPPQAQAPQGASVPPAALAALKGNPTLAAQFDAKYGPGASARALGR